MVELVSCFAEHERLHSKVVARKKSLEMLMELHMNEEKKFSAHMESLEQLVEERYSCTGTRTGTSPHGPALAHAHAHLYSNEEIRMRDLICMHTLTHQSILMCIRTHSLHVLTHASAHMHAHTCICTHVRIQTRTHSILSHVRAEMCINSRARTHDSCTWSQARAHTYGYVRTDGQAQHVGVHLQMGDTCVTVCVRA